MTDRAEIERLLNQTGRTLEGLPDEHSREDRNRELSTWMPWGEKMCHQSDVIELLVGALRDALEKPMQKPLTPEELRIRVYSGHPAYVEENRNDRSFDGYALAEVLEDAVDFMMDEYGTCFRCWVSKPTDKEREAAVWET